MRRTQLFVLALVTVSVAMGPDPEVGPADPPSVKDLSRFDLTQSTCALFVSLRSRALDDPGAFGRDPEDVAVHWNMCASGNMVACSAPKGALGDTAVSGIPWPY